MNRRRFLNTILIAGIVALPGIAAISEASFAQTEKQAYEDKEHAKTEEKAAKEDKKLDEKKAKADKKIQQAHEDKERAKREEKAAKHDEY